MTFSLQVDDQTTDAEGFIKFMKLDGRLSGVAQALLNRKLTVQAARRSGVDVSAEEVNQLARVCLLYQRWCS